ncbi:MAG: AAA family ATPase, partial [Oceanihabitans sp.]
MKTKKIVITGGPGTGKSSIINELIKRGYGCF